MNRLESIKETWKDFKDHDVNYLLQRLERYEKALKNIVEEADQHNSEVWERMKEMERIAKETLKE